MTERTPAEVEAWLADMAVTDGTPDDCPMPISAKEYREVWELAKRALVAEALVRESQAENARLREENTDLYLDQVGPEEHGAEGVPMTTSTLDLELRKQVAEKLGCHDCFVTADGVLMGFGPELSMCIVIPEYDLSLDACIRDVVPWARERGWNWQMYNCATPSGDYYGAKFFQHKDGEYLVFAAADEHAVAKAFCQAFVELPEKE